jgi:hypothetical protein
MVGIGHNRNDIGGTMILTGYARAAAGATSRPQVLGAVENSAYGGAAVVPLTGKGSGRQPIIVSIMIQNGSSITAAPADFGLLHSTTHPETGELFVYGWNASGPRPSGTLSFTLSSNINWVIHALEVSGTGLGVLGAVNRVGGAGNYSSEPLTAMAGGSLVVDIWAHGSPTAWTYTMPRGTPLYPTPPVEAGQWLAERTNAGRMYVLARPGPASAGAIPASQGSVGGYGKFTYVGLEVLG